MDITSGVIRLLYDDTVDPPVAVDIVLDPVRSAVMVRVVFEPIGPRITYLMPGFELLSKTAEMWATFRKFCRNVELR